MNRFNTSNPQFAIRASLGQGGRFHGGDNFGRASNNGGRNVLPPLQNNLTRDFSSSRGRGGFALSGFSRRPVTDHDSVMMEIKDVKSAISNETMPKGILKTPAKMDEMVNVVTSMEMNNGWGETNDSNEGMNYGIGRELKTVTFDTRPVEVELNGNNVDTGNGRTIAMGQMPFVNEGNVLRQNNVAEGFAEIDRLVKSDDLVTVKKLTAKLMRSLSVAFYDFAESLDKMNSTHGGH